MADVICCKTCALYDIDAHGGRVRRDRVARCLWTMPAIDLPLSVEVGKFGWNPPRPRFMEPYEGVGCPCWKRRT